MHYGHLVFVQQKSRLIGQQLVLTRRATVPLIHQVPTKNQLTAYAFEEGDEPSRNGDERKPHLCRWSNEHGAAAVSTSLLAHQCIFCLSARSAGFCVRPSNQARSTARENSVSLLYSPSRQYKARTKLLTRSPNQVSGVRRTGEPTASPVRFPSPPRTSEPSPESSSPDLPPPSP